MIGICSDKCDIRAYDFTSHIMIFACDDLLNDIIALYFSILVFIIIYLEWTALF